MPHDDHWQLLDALPDAILFVDADKGIVFANQQAEEMFGVSREQLHGRQVEDLLPERFRKKHVAHRAKHGACPIVRPMGADLDLYAVRSNGEEFPVEQLGGRFRRSRNSEHGRYSISVSHGGEPVARLTLEVSAEV